MSEKKVLTAEDFEKELELIKAEKLRARITLTKQIFRVVFFPIVIVVGFFVAIVFGTLFALLGESLKKIN
jgi:hypothetical protein